MSADKQTFEERLNRIESMAESLESGKLGLEEAMQLFEDGMKELDALEKELSQAQQRLTVIRDRGDGTLVETPDVPSSET